MIFTEALTHDADVEFNGTKLIEYATLDADANDALNADDGVPINVGLI